MATAYKRATPEQRKKIESELNSCNSMAEIFAVLNKNFDLKNCKPGMITKRAVITGLTNTVLPMVNPDLAEPKAKATPPKE